MLGELSTKSRADDLSKKMRRHSTLGYVSPVQFEEARKASCGVIRIGSRPIRAPTVAIMCPSSTWLWLEAPDKGLKSLLKLREYR